MIQKLTILTMSLFQPSREAASVEEHGWAWHFHTEPSIDGQASRTTAYGGTVTWGEQNIDVKLKHIAKPQHFHLSKHFHLKTVFIPQNEPLYIRCAHCQLVRPLADARGQYCSCRHCYTYYCCRGCRQKDWERHRDRCSFARINSLCKEVIMKVRSA